MILSHLVAITVAFIIDRIVGDPPNWPHPVRWIGSLIATLDQKWNIGSRQRIKGIGMVVTVLVLVFGVTLLITRIGYIIHPVVGIVVESMIIAITIAQKSLRDAAYSVYEPLQKKDITAARLKLSYIVGRDTDQLDEQEIVRGAVETVAENTSDGVTAPMFWALLGGASLAMVYRAINTCDSMVGYRNEKYQDFGWASAKLDDLVNWIPSRITAFVMFLGSSPEHTTMKNAWRLMRRDAKKHPSPNSGWGEAAVAALLGIQLGGINTYKGIISDRARMGEPIVPLDPIHILKVTRLLYRTTLLFLCILWLGGMFIELAFTWFQSSIFI